MNNPHRVVIAIIVLSMAVPVAGSEATTINVPGDYTSIQAAINAATNGKDILVHNGIYQENIDFLGKAITVRTTEGAVIDGSNSGNVVTFNSGESSNSVLDGFTITNGSATYGGGIYCSSSSSPLISNCIIFSNLGSIDGGGFYLTSSSPSIQNCIVKDNTVNYSGGGFCILWSSPTIANCTISNNIGSGITCGTDSHSYIVNCLITNNTYSPNTDSGGGLGCGGGNPLVVNSTITSNLASTYGGGIYLQDSCSATVINSIAWGNKNESGGTYSTEIFIRDGNSSIDITYSDIQGGYTGTGNIDSDPLFVGGGDYHLYSGSPCIDAASSNPPAPATDKDGNARYDDTVTEDSGTGAITYYDMGAYEYLGSGTASINLIDGWNLISLNFQPADPSIAAVLGTVADNCNSVWMFHNGWKAYYPDFPEYSDLDTMEIGWGYWLNMTGATTLSVSGTIPSKTVFLNAGWNLVGCNSANSMPIAEAIESITGDCESVWVYINGGWNAYYPAFPEYSDLENMDPNHGYWIKTKKACDWTLPPN